jgi:hypothetical protein
MSQLLLYLGVSAVTVAKAYRLLKAIMNTAVDDGLIRRNPCRIKGAGQERSDGRSALQCARFPSWQTLSVHVIGP